MAHSLFRLTSKVFNTPHLICAENLRPIVEYLQTRNYGEMLGDTVYKGERQGLQTEELNIFNGVGVIQILGTLTYKTNEWACEETTSYQDLIDETEELISAGVKAIIFECASGGGEASHMFSTAQQIRAMLDESGVYSMAYVDELAASACYGIACICDEIVIHPEARAGSIGAMIALRDDSKAMDEAGIKDIYITDKPGKVPFAKDGSFKDSFLEKLQIEVNKLGDKFNQHVSTYIGVSVDEIKVMDAQVFTAEDALANGLVNKIMDHQEFSDYVSSKFSQ